MGYGTEQGRQRRSRPRGISGLFALAAAAALQAGLAAAALAAQQSSTLVVAAQVGRRAAIAADRPVVTLEPGRSVTVAVTVKARLAAGELAPLVLETFLPAAGRAELRGLVTYELAGRRGALSDRTVIGEVARSGVAVLPLTLALSAAADGPVTLPLAFRLAAAGSPLVVASSTHLAP
ncbi:MAG TPA: hypothetical protein VNM66_07640 [Thermodesulfobacteriota bacterium]|nr:hypothetical protein [Thermodesulfobacteriota bacterium]